MITQPGLTIWVVYDHPLDWPDHYVARRWDGELPTEDLVVTFDLELLREHLADKGLARLDRRRNDDPVILETWL
jgi:hypothetical protein